MVFLTKDLEWYVYVEDFNNKMIRRFNIFDHYRFKDDCIIAWKKYKNDIDEFAKQVHKELTYYFWSKCEWEVILQCDNFNEKKIDVADQIEMNWDAFIESTVSQFRNRKHTVQHYPMR